MSVKSDRWIRRMAEEHQLIQPFEAALVREVGGTPHHLRRAPPPTATTCGSPTTASASSRPSTAARSTPRSSTRSRSSKPPLRDGRRRLALLPHAAALLRPRRHGRDLPHAPQRHRHLHVQIDLRPRRPHASTPRRSKPAGRAASSSSSATSPTSPSASTSTKASARSSSSNPTKTAPSPTKTAAANTKAKPASPTRGCSLVGSRISCKISTIGCKLQKLIQRRQCVCEWNHNWAC